MRRTLPLLAMLGCHSSPAPQGAGVELALIGGDVRTMDPAHPHASAVAIDHGTIVAVGDDAAIRTRVGTATRVIDLRGATVTPGLVDAHCHLYGLGVDLENVNLRGQASEAATVKLVADAAKTRPAGEWLIGRGWDQNRWPGAQFPTRATLDAAVSDRPVLLRRVDGHAVWLNSVALRAAGIEKATPDPEGGKIVRDAAGEPTGVLVDNAGDLVEAKLPVASLEQRKRRISAAIEVALQAGITGVHEMGIEDATADAYRALDREGKLPLRVYAYLAGDPKALDRFARPPAGEPAGSHFTMRGVKFFVDGALGSRGARLYADYSDDPGNRGLWVTEPAQLTKAVDAAVAGGWQVAIHAIGDAGVGAVIDAYEAANAAHPGEHRLRIEHTQVIAPADVERMAKAKAIASMQPTHATSDMPWAEARLGKDRVVGAYAWRTMLEHGIPLAAGSDFPVEEVRPLLGIYAAVTRQDADGKPADGWYPKQRLTLDEAIAAFTRGAAFAQFADGRRGMIAVGRDADVTVFDRALSADRTLLGTSVTFAVIDGKVRFEQRVRDNR